jgi:hypothetical protein
MSSPSPWNCTGEWEFLTGQSAAAAERFTMPASRAANTVDQAIVACWRMDVYTTLDESDRAVAVCLDYIRHLGVEWSPQPTAAEQARCEYERIWSQLGSRAVEQLLARRLVSQRAM